VRFSHRSGETVHLSYCSNVHPAEDAEGVARQLGRYAASVREALGVGRLGVGLWLAHAAASKLADDPAALRKLRSRLGGHGLEVVTFNGFPYRAFHAPVVKKSVYEPDWTDPRRAEYTLTLARLLAELLPDDVNEGTISTLPLGWREGWTERETEAARRALSRVAEGLEKLSEGTGRSVRLAVEPEPGCIVETTEGAIAALEGLDGRWIGLCLDACHLAVQFESARGAVDALREAGLLVFKAQLSSALKVGRPRSPGARAALADFDEPRFMHQVRERAPGGLLGVDDLPEALAGGLPGEGEWRVHFHVPIHHAVAEHAEHTVVGTTQGELVGLLDALLMGETPETTHLEVETYTWTVLPPEERPEDDAGLVRGIARELAWTSDRLVGMGLERADASRGLVV